MPGALKIKQGLSFPIAVLMVAAAGMPAQAQSARDVVIGSCKNDLQRTDSECECFANEAEKQFTEKEYKFFVGMLQGRDQMEVVNEVGGMNLSDMQSVGLKMERIPAICEGK